MLKTPFQHGLMMEDIISVFKRKEGGKKEKKKLRELLAAAADWCDFECLNRNIQDWEAHRWPCWPPNAANCRPRVRLLWRTLPSARDSIRGRNRRLAPPPREAVRRHPVRRRPPAATTRWPPPPRPTASTTTTRSRSTECRRTGSSARRPRRPAPAPHPSPVWVLDSAWAIRTIRGLVWERRPPRLTAATSTLATRQRRTCTRARPTIRTSKRGSSSNTSSKKRPPSTVPVGGTCTKRLPPADGWTWAELRPCRPITPRRCTRPPPPQPHRPPTPATTRHRWLRPAARPICSQLANTCCRTRTNRCSNTTRPSRRHLASVSGQPDTKPRRRPSLRPQRQPTRWGLLSDKNLFFLNLNWTETKVAVYWPPGPVTSFIAPLHGKGHLRLPQLPGGGPSGSGRRSFAQAQHPQLPHPRLRESVRQDVPLESPSAMAHGRASVRLQLALLRQKIHPLRRAPASPPHSHRRETLRLPRLQQALHALRSPQQTRQDAQRWRRWRKRRRHWKRRQR